MKKRELYAMLLALLLMTVAACQPSPAATQAPAEEAAGVDDQTVVLEIIGPETTKTLTMADVKALSPVEGWGGTKSSTGRITVPVQFKGVRLQDLWSLVGNVSDEVGMNVIASDGYGMTFSYDQIVNANLITYDPATGDEITVDESLIPILAYERDGNPIGDDGPLRIAVLSSKNNQVVDGHWAIKWVNKITLRSLAEEWSLQLNGAITEEIDRATFESCTASGCHQSSWTDDHAQTWVGVPLWEFAGYADDDNKHTTPAYREDLADLNYIIEVIAADGYSVEIESTRANRNDNIIVSAMANDNPLEEGDFPLRLVGSDLEKSEMVGQIAEIKLHLPADQ